MTTLPSSANDSRANQLDGPRRLAWLAGIALLIHVGLLAWGAYRHSPTLDEVGHLPAGISHWQLGKFDLYCVNPPLVRMVAALPVLAVRPQMDWRTFNPRTRSEFSIGNAFIAANGQRSFWLFTLARWACVPFSLLGGYICWRWAGELFGRLAGIVGLTLWCFGPNILAHGQLITPDIGATSLTIAAAYVFWHWLKDPSWELVLTSGFMLGLAELAKATCLLLFALWPALWLIWQVPEMRVLSRRAWLRRSAQLASVLFLALGILNAGYGFEGVFQRLGDYHFVGRLFGGPGNGSAEGSPLDGRNRFAGSWLARIPVPLPKHYLRGLDLQRQHLENSRGGVISYLRGELRPHGWWYYYLYALTVKVPLGAWMLLLLAVFLTAIRRGAGIGWRNELMLIVPPLAILLLVSSQTGFTLHLRYVLPIFPFVFIWTSRVASRTFHPSRLANWTVSTSVLWLVASSLWVYPHSLSYFNELAGGPAGGANHLLDSNIDWGQDLLYLKRWLQDHPEARPLGLACFGFYDYHLVDPAFTDAPAAPAADHPIPSDIGPRPGWYAVSVNQLHGYGLGGMRDPRFVYFQHFAPIDRIGYSIWIYYITPDEANRVRNVLGLKELPKAESSAVKPSRPS